MRGTGTGIGAGSSRGPRAYPKWSSFDGSAPLTKARRESSEGGIRKPVSMSDVVVEKVGTEANVGDAARSRNRQEWRADVKGAEGETEEATTEGAAVAEAARKKLDELEKQGL